MRTLVLPRVRGAMECADKDVPSFCSSIAFWISLPFVFLEIHCYFQRKNDKIKISTTLNSLEAENEGKKSKGRKDWGKKNGKRKERRR